MCRILTKFYLILRTIAFAWLNFFHINQPFGLNRNVSQKRLGWVLSWFGLNNYKNGLSFLSAHENNKHLLCLLRLRVRTDNTQPFLWNSITLLEIFPHVSIMTFLHVFLSLFLLFIFFGNVALYSNTKLIFLWKRSANTTTISLY